LKTQPSKGVALDMKYLKQCLKTGFFSIFLALSSSKINAETKTIFIPISQGSNLYAQYHKPAYFDYNEQSWYLDVSTTYRYMQTRKGDTIAAKLLDYSTLTFQGEEDYIGIARDNERGLVSEYFGFPYDANFKISLEPRIQNHVIDIQLAIGGENLWVQVNAPITHSKWEVNKSGTPKITGTLGKKDKLQGEDGGELKLESSAGNVYANSIKTLDVKAFDAIWENSLDVGKGFADADEMNVEPGPITKAVEKDAVTDSVEPEEGMGSWGSTKITGVTALTNIPSALTFNDNNPLTITEDVILAASSVKKGLEGYTFGNLKEKKYNNFNFSDSSLQADWKLADIHLQIGYDFYKADSNHFGLYIKAVIPTGTAIDKTLLKKTFNPIIGNGNRLEVGAGLNGRVEFFTIDNNESSMIINFDGYMTHMFTSNQFRTFDKIGMPMSRYAIVKQLTYDSEAKSDRGEDPYYHKYVLKALGDVNSGMLDVSCDIRGEAMIDLSYRHHEWTIGGGYSFSGQTKEKASSLVSTSDGYYYGFKAGTEEDDLLLKLETCKAVGESGTVTFDEIFCKMEVTTNSVEDNNTAVVQITFSAKTSGDVGVNGTGGAYAYPDDTGDTDLGTITKDVFQLPDYNRSGLMDGQILHRVFGHLDYTWIENAWMPHVGIMGAFGFDTSSYRTAQYWDIGARIGLSY
jgi:hypothetical protein